MTARPLAQKTIGILGGSSNVATAEYYRQLNALANARLGGWDIAEILIASMNFGNIEAWVRADDWPALEAYMATKVDGLEAGGADLVLCVSNTLHRPLEGVMAGRNTPWIHIADPTGRAIREAGLSRIALFGTRPAMEGPHLVEHYARRFGLSIAVPRPDEIADIDRIIFDELVRDRIEPASKARYLEIADRMRREDGIEGLILGCTEIPLLISQPDRPDLPMFDTTRLHCQAAIDAALA